MQAEDKARNSGNNERSKVFGSYVFRCACNQICVYLVRYLFRYVKVVFEVGLFHICSVPLLVNIC